MTHLNGPNRYIINRFACSLETGALYEGMDRTTRKKVMISRLFSKDHESDFDLWKDDFASLVSRAARVSHPRVMPFLQAGVDDDGPYLVYEHFRPVELLKAFPDAMPQDEFLRFAQQVIEGLQAIHANGFVHGALGLQSFLVSKKLGGRDDYLICDVFMNSILPQLQGYEKDEFLPSHA
ncbi:MAG: protein kinase, partial [Phaeodactylibacter sp.]|nr:protein kinase [Phaeodactylibacter sp.]